MIQLNLYKKDIREKYIEIVDKFSDRIVTIDGNLSVTVIAKIIWKVITDRIPFE